MRSFQFILLLILIQLSGNAVRAQQQNGIESSRPDISFQLGGQLSRMLQDPAMRSQFRLALHFKKGWQGGFAGFSASFLTSGSSVNETLGLIGSELDARQQSVGLVIGHSHELLDWLQVRASVEPAWALLVYDYTDGSRNRLNYFQLEPGADLVFRIRRNDHIGFGLGVSYRAGLTGGQDGIGMPELGGPAGNFFLILGTF